MLDCPCHPLRAVYDPKGSVRSVGHEVDPCSEVDLHPRFVRRLALVNRGHTERWCLKIDEPHFAELLISLEILDRYGDGPEQ